MTDITSIFGGAYEPNKYVEPPEVQLADAMRAAGLDPPSNIRIDGQLHRFSTKGRKKDDSGWYVAFPEPPVAGRFGCWRDQIDVVFHAEMERQFTSDELMIIQKRQSEARHRRDEERERKATVAASTVYKIWSEASAAHEEHPYLVKKGIKSHGARVTGDGRLIVPLYGEDGNLSSLQYIEKTRSVTTLAEQLRAALGFLVTLIMALYLSPRATLQPQQLTKYPIVLLLLRLVQITCRKLLGSYVRSLA